MFTQKSSEESDRSHSVGVTCLFGYCLSEIPVTPDTCSETRNIALLKECDNSAGAQSIKISLLSE